MFTHDLNHQAHALSQLEAQQAELSRRLDALERLALTHHPGEDQGHDHP